MPSAKRRGSALSRPSRPPRRAGDGPKAPGTSAKSDVAAVSALLRGIPQSGNGECAVLIAERLRRIS